MIIAITGGKGGTGKSTVAVALAYELSRSKKVLLLDLDVDCPNDNLILDIDTKKIKDINSMIPKFDEEKCISCGKCAEVCKVNAIVKIKKNLPILVPEQCNGCKTCLLVCPASAISEEKKVIGEIHKGNGDFDLIFGALKPGCEESAIVVNAVRNYAKKFQDNYDHIIIDTAAGTHCPVIASLLGVDLGIAVTEPTPLGAHDLVLILDLMKSLNIKQKIIINRSDIADKKIIDLISKEKKVDIIGEIHFSRKIAEDYAAGRPLEHETINKIVKVVK